MTQQPLISIITVVFNGETHLQQTIDSVVNQTYKHIEYIIIDGGSSDRTLNIIKSNEAHINYWVSEPDNGLYDAMNKGIDLANGELVGMVNSDDWYEPNAVEVVVNTYLKHPEKRIFHADRYDVYPNGEKKIYVFNPSVIKFKYFSMTYSHPSMFVSRKLYEDYKYNTDLNVYSDYQFALTSYKINKHQFIHINQPIVNFRLGGVSGQISLKKVIKESYIARRRSGMNIFVCIIGIGCKLGLETIKFFINKK